MRAATLGAVANGISNRLTMRGNEAELAELAAALADPADPERSIAFEHVLPPPAELEGADNLRWRDAHWGVTYAPRLVNLEHELQGRPAPAGERVYFFTSDGEVPLAFVAWVAAEHPGIQIELVYQERGDGIAGRALFEGGRPLKAFESADPDACRALLAEHWPDALADWE
jgi:hypothetical protein